MQMDGNVYGRRKKSLVTLQKNPVFSKEVNNLNIEIDNRAAVNLASS